MKLLWRCRNVLASQNVLLLRRVHGLRVARTNLWSRDMSKDWGSEQKGMTCKAINFRLFVIIICRSADNIVLKGEQEAGVVVNIQTLVPGLDRPAIRFGTFKCEFHMSLHGWDVQGTQILDKQTRRAFWLLSYRHVLRHSCVVRVQHLESIHRNFEDHRWQHDKE